MDRFQQWHALDQILKARRFPVARKVLEEELQVSESTIKRIIRDMRNYGAPIETSRDRKWLLLRPGYCIRIARRVVYA